MDQPLPPRPALFLNLVVMSKPFRFGQLFANLWVTHSHTNPLMSIATLCHGIGPRGQGSGRDYLKQSYDRARIDPPVLTYSDGLWTYNGLAQYGKE
jgi:hypothetical protein